MQLKLYIAKEYKYIRCVYLDFKRIDGFFVLILHMCFEDTKKKGILLALMDFFGRVSSGRMCLLSSTLLDPNIFAIATKTNIICSERLSRTTADTRHNDMCAYNYYNTIVHHYFSVGYSERRSRGKIIYCCCGHVTTTTIIYGDT